MSRHGAGAAKPVVAYVLRYALAEKKILSGIKERRSKDGKASKRDLAAVKAMLMGTKMLNEISDLGLEKNHAKYFQKHVLSQLEKEADKTEGSQFDGIIKHNVYGHSIRQFVKQFEKVQAERTFQNSRTPSLHHVVLSFHPEDRKLLTTEIVLDMVQKYFSLRGELLYCGAIHQNTSHLHVHIVQSAVQLSGKSARMSKEEFQNLKIELERYQQERYPQLHRSAINHQPKPSYQKHIPDPEKIKNSNERNLEKEKARQCFAELAASANSQKEMLNLLKERGFEGYERRGEFVGVVSESTGIKFRFSTLGVSLDEIVKRENSANKQLDSLRNLRASNVRELGFLSVSQPEIRPMNAKDEQVLSQLQNLRDGNISRGIPKDEERNQEEDTRDEIENSENVEDKNGNAPDDTENRDHDDLER